ASYIGLIGLAERYWSSNQAELAERQLDLCPPRLRHWEWRFLKGLCQAELSSVHGPAGQTGLSVLSQDGRVAASVCQVQMAIGLPLARHEVHVWNAATGADLCTVTPERAFSAPKALALSADGKLLAAADADHTIHLYDVSGGEAVHRAGLTGHTRAVA